MVAAAPWEPHDKKHGGKSGEPLGGFGVAGLGRFWFWSLGLCQVGGVRG